MKRFFFTQLTALLLAASLDAVEKYDYTRDVRPILETHCFKCHGPDKQKSDVRFDTLSPDLVKDRPAAETWHDAKNALNLGEMPPDDEPELSSEERGILTGWIDQQLDKAIAAQKSSGGEVILRRLNRIEYQNTMTDLLGIAADYAANLPPDTPSEEGFKNNGDSLTMSPMQLEYYLEAARSGLSRAIVTGPAPKVISTTLTDAADVSKRNRANITDRLGLSGSYVARLDEFPDEGEFVVRVKARAEMVKGAAYPRLKAAFGYRADTQAPSRDLGIVDVTKEESQVFEFRGRMEQFPIQTRTQSKFPGQRIWLTNAFKDGKKRQEKRKIDVEETITKKGKTIKRMVRKIEWIEYDEFPKIIIESVEFVGPIYESWPPRHHTRILPPSEKRDTGELVYAEEVVSKFMARAYRRPVSNTEVVSILRLFSKIRPGVESFEEAIRETLALVLVSPDFLYLVEPEPGKRDAKTPLTAFELASRLSYFLWSTMPDDYLFDLAASGELLKPDTLAAEIERMLADEKSWQFIRHFTDQWLDLGSVDRVAVNPEYYEDWDTSIEPDMQEETRRFFAEVLKNDLSALNFIDSDFAVLNARMAAHYGLEERPPGTAFERIALPEDSPRGGLLTHSSMLLGNSTGEDSHPILRAVWIRERLLDDPPAPPPPNVPELDSENKNFAKLSVRKQLELHRKEAACNDCHRRIDPWGIALESFDAVGNLREEIRRKSGKKFITQPVDDETELPGGHRIEGIEGLKKFLLGERKDQFAGAVVARLTSYALGRSLELSDEPVLEALGEDFEANGYRLRPLIHAIVKSELFQTK